MDALLAAPPKLNVGAAGLLSVAPWAAAGAVAGALVPPKPKLNAGLVAVPEAAPGVVVAPKAGVDVVPNAGVDDADDAPKAGAGAVDDPNAVVLAGVVDDPNVGVDEDPPNENTGFGVPASG